MTSPNLFVSPADVVTNLLPNVSFSIGNSFETLVVHADGVVLPSQEEYNAKLLELQNALPLKLLREERNKRLVEYDWVTLRACSGGPSLTEDFKNYMNALRNLPATSTPAIFNNQLINVEWPIKPHID